MYSENAYLILWSSIKPNRKRQMLALIMLTMFSSVAELVSIGAIVPFLAVLTKPDRVFELGFLSPVWSYFNIDSSEAIIQLVTVAFILSVIVAGFFRLLLNFVSIRLGSRVSIELSSIVYEKCLYQPYSVQVTKNSAELISSIISKVSSVLTQVIYPVINIISSVIILLVICFSLIVVNWKVSTMLFSILIFSYFLIGFYLRNRVKKNGEIIAKRLTDIQQALQEGFGAIREIIIGNLEEYHVKKYRSVDFQFRELSADTAFISIAPRHIMEAIGISVLASYAFVISSSSSELENVVPLLGFIAVAAQRAFPLLQICYNSWSNLRAGRQNLEDIADILRSTHSIGEAKFVREPMLLDSVLELKDVSFQYQADGPIILSSINFSVKKGERVGIIGPSGSGKSTLLDILMGLLKPDQGLLSIDGQPITQANLKSWQAAIAHVPQDIYLLDSTFAENIAFGIDLKQIDMGKVMAAAKSASIAEFIESMPNSYNTRVGEQGDLLSGGQRQRIGIARAIYREKSVLFLDEATSSLDGSTESDILKSVMSLDSSTTIFFIAHNLSSLKYCDRIIEIYEGQIVERERV